MALDIRVASPCPANWQAMTGDDHVRHCDQCDLDVFNFSEMTEKQIKSLLSQGRERVCGRIYRRADGTMLTRDCPVGFRAKVRRISRIAGAALSAAVGFTPAIAQTTVGSRSQDLVQITSQSNEIDLVVTDQTAAIIRGADVMITLDGKSVANGKKDESGRFRLLPQPGIYDVRVQSPGFLPYKYEGPLASGQKIVMRPNISATMGVIVDVSQSEVPSTTMSTHDFLPEPAVSSHAQPSTRTASTPHNPVLKFFYSVSHKLGI